MRHFHASAVERRIIVSQKFESHPMETGWASEAIFFLIVEEAKNEGNLEAKVELSADGINWVSEGSSFPVINSSGHYFTRVKHFGNWLRVSGTVQGDGAEFKLSVHLHLKE
jgi:hypothetical protein